jgi:uncharacterized protein (DUF885 family)
MLCSLIRVAGPVAVLVALGCTPSAEGPLPYDTGSDTEAGTARQELQALFRDEWTTRVARDPLFASTMGIRDYDDALPIDPPSNHQRFLQEDLEFLERLQAIDRSELSDHDRLNYDLFRFVVKSRTTLANYQPWLIPILSDGGFHMHVQRMYEAMPFTTIEHYENYLSRLREIPPYFAQHIDHMREGMRIGMTQPKAILDGIESSISGPIVANAADSIFFTPFKSMPAHFSDGDRQRLRSQAIDAIEQEVVPSYRHLLSFFTREYKPGAREEVGAFALPDGEAYYAELVKFFTTLDDATPDAIHDLGLREVARIRAEMNEVMRQVEFDGNFGAFIEFLRTDSRFYVSEPEDLLKEASFIAKKIDG